MTGNVYAVASGKGGVGKTTTAINLGAMLAASGHEVVVVDTDLGMANVEGFLDFDLSGPTLHDVLAGDASVEDAIYEAPGDIDVLPSSMDIHAFARSETANLQGVVRTLRDSYEYVLLDTGAGISYDTMLPLSLANAVLLVTTPDVASVRDTAKTGELTEHVDGTVRGAVLTQRSNDILNEDDVEGTLDTDVLAVVPADEAVPMGIDAGRPLAAFAPNSPAAKAYRELAGVLDGTVAEPSTVSDDASESSATSPTASDPPATAESLAAPDDGEGSSSEPDSGGPSPTEDSGFAPALADAEDEFPRPDTTDAEAAATPSTEGADPSIEEAEPSTGDADGSETEPDPNGPDSVYDLIDERIVDAEGEPDDAEEFEAVLSDIDERMADERPDEEPVERPDADAADGPTSAASADEGDASPSDSDATPAEPDCAEPDRDGSDGVDASAAEADGESDLPEGVDAAEPETDGSEGAEAVPFGGDSATPELDAVTSKGDDDEDEGDGSDADGFFGRIGSLFR